MTGIAIQEVERLLLIRGARYQRMRGLSPDSNAGDAPLGF
jgi:hypothetical protein